MGTDTEQLGFAGKDLSAIPVWESYHYFCPDVRNFLSVRLKTSLFIDKNDLRNLNVGHA